MRHKKGDMVLFAEETDTKLQVHHCGNNGELKKARKQQLKNYNGVNEGAVAGMPKLPFRLHHHRF